VPLPVWVHHHTPSLDLATSHILIQYLECVAAWMAKLAQG
jgi:hypothetical protein